METEPSLSLSVVYLLRIGAFTYAVSTTLAWFFHLIRRELLPQPL